MNQKIRTQLTMDPLPIYPEKLPLFIHYMMLHPKYYCKTTCFLSIKLMKFFGRGKGSNILVIYWPRTSFFKDNFKGNLGISGESFRIYGAWLYVWKKFVHVEAKANIVKGCTCHGKRLLVQEERIESHLTCPSHGPLKLKAPWIFQRIFLASLESLLHMTTLWLKTSQGPISS